VEPTTALIVAAVAFYQHCKTKNSTLIEIKGFGLINAQIALA
jgi:hypothetical protein